MWGGFDVAGAVGGARRGEFVGGRVGGSHRNICSTRGRRLKSARNLIGAGQLVLSVGGSEARVDLGKGSYVRVTGTVDPSVLVDVARRLVPGPGGSLVIG